MTDALVTTSRSRPVIPLSRDDYYREVTALRDRVCDLEAENAYLRGCLAPPTTLLRAWRLTPAEERLLLAMASNPEGMTKEGLHRALSAGPFLSSHIKIVDVKICHLRRKLRAHGVVIETLWGRGYRLSDASRSLVLAAATGEGV